MPAIGSISTDPVRLVLKGVSYAIPRNYFGYPAHGCGAEEPAIVLRAFLPDFSGATKKTLEEFESVGGGWRRVVQIHLRATVQVPKLAGFVVVWTDPFQVTWDGTEAYGLEHGSYRDAVWKWDLFVERRNNEVTHVIKCTSPLSVPYPHCTSAVFFKGAQLEITFDRKRLLDWREIQDGVTILLERFAQSGSKH